MRAFGKNIFVELEDVDVQQGGLILPNVPDTEYAWAKVISVGKDVIEVKKDTRILIERPSTRKLISLPKEPLMFVITMEYIVGIDSV